jgi:hypothetical protein
MEGNGKARMGTKGAQASSKYKKNFLKQQNYG